MFGEYSTVARSVARFTVAPLTPSTPASAPSTWWTQAAHVMPPMFSVTFSAA